MPYRVLRLVRKDEALDKEVEGQICFCLDDIYLHVVLYWRSNIIKINN